ncbi:MAG: hypothetical protein ABI612_10530 [Betaproteobacteria bacterium]
MRFHQSILGFKGGRYLKLALGLCAAAVAAYAWYEPPLPYPKAYGGTWMGYTLGTVAAGIVLLLLTLGMRKRSYRSTLGTVQEWTSAHVYLGLSVLLIATLHCAFEFGWNIHTYAYALLATVVVSGIVGVTIYVRCPRLLTNNLGEDTLQTLALKIADLDRQCSELAMHLPDKANAAVRHARRTRIGGSLIQRIAGNAVRCPTRAACESLRRFGADLSGQQAAVHQQLVLAMTRRGALLDRARRDLQLSALLQGWLYFHVPLSFALLGALITHVVAVFYFR